MESLDAYGAEVVQEKDDKRVFYRYEDPNYLIGVDQRLKEFNQSSV
jgi:hypothetical protein